MRSRMIAYVAGISTIVWLPQLPPLTFLALLSLPLLYWRKLPAFVIAFLLGAVWSLVWCHWQMAHRLDTLPVKSDWRVSGVVVGLPQQQGQQVRFLFKPERLEVLRGAQLHSAEPRLLRLSWFKAPIAPEPGMRLMLDVRLKPPHGYANPYGSDYELWLLAQGVDAAGYVRRQVGAESWGRCFVDCFRARIARYVEYRYAEAFPLILAITLGIRDRFDEGQWQQLRATGTIHLAVISGLHIGFVVVLCLALVKLMSFVVAPHVVRPAGVLFTCAVAFAYMQLAGAGLPTQRAFIMVAVFLLAQWRLWYVDLWSRWWLAMALVLTALPVATHLPGFWLSFIAVATLLWFAAHRLRDLLGWRTQIGIFFGMTPVLIWLFGGFSLIAPLVNLLAIPLVALCLTITVVDLGTSLVGLSFLLPVVEGLVKAFWWLVELGSQLQSEIWRTPEPEILSVVLAGVGSFLLVQPQGFPLRWLGVLLWLPLLLGGERDERGAGFEAWVFDVGQGTAVLLEVADRYLLYDTGPAFPGGQSGYRHTLAPYIEARAIHRLDRLILSHNDLDHTGGHRELRDQTEVLQGMTGSAEVAKRYEYQLCLPGEAWRWGGVSFSVLAGGAGDSDNNSSCVVLVDDGHCTLLLTGDIDQRLEQTLPPRRVPLTWLVASHHGSKTGTGENFLRGWQPQHVIYSAGFANRFGHPAEEVLARVARVGAEQMLTARQGAIHLRAANGQCSARSWRDTRRRFWSGY